MANAYCRNPSEIKPCLTTRQWLQHDCRARNSLSAAFSLRQPRLQIASNDPPAIHCDELIRDGVVADQSELARLLHVTQPRMTQIMNLLLLAPDIQETLLFLPRVLTGEDPVMERDLRAVVADVDWGRQREIWENL